MAEASSSRVRIGPAPLGEILPPAPPDASVLLTNDPGIDATPLLYGAVHEQLSQGQDVIVAVLDRPPSTFVEEMGEVGYSPASAAGRLVLVDAFSARWSASEEQAAAYSVEDVGDAEALARVLEGAGSDHPGAGLVLDSLSGWVDRVEPDGLPALVSRCEQIVESFGLTVASYTSWPYEADMQGLRDPFDAHVEVEGLQDRAIFSQCFRIHQATWAADPPKRRHIFEAQGTGGVRLARPQLIVSGPSQSGKSTFVNTASQEPVAPETLDEPPMVLRGRAEIADIETEIVTLPNEADAQAIAETSEEQLLGLLVLVDATRPSTFDRARELLETARSRGAPRFLVANKQDLPGAVSAQQLSSELGLDPWIRVVECEAKQPASVRSVLDRVGNRLLGEEVLD